MRPTVAVASESIEQLETDVLVIGSGFAGLWAAITARVSGVERVAILDKGDIARSSQSRMSAGATVYRLPEDDLDTWVLDVCRAQRWLCHQDMVEDMLETSTSRLRRLEQWGVGYERVGESYFRLPSRGFEHLQMMVLPQYGGRTGGSAVTRALREQVVRRRCILVPRTFATELLVGPRGVTGVVGFDRGTAQPVVVSASAVVLASGDCSFRGQYACVDSATGDGFALAARAGVRLANMEFLVVNTGPPEFGFEGTGVATRFGGTFRNAEGESFMSTYDPAGDSAEVAYLVRAMAIEAQEGSSPITLDLSAASHENSFLRMAFERMGGFMPLNLQRLAESGTDIFGEGVLWEPAVQTLRGGVRTDLHGRSDLPGLFAAGMTQAFDPGLFNGWSSMRAMWSGQRAGEAAARFVLSGGDDGWDVAGPSARAGALAGGSTGEAIGRALSPLSVAHDRDAVGPDSVLAELQEALFARDVCLLKTPEALSESSGRVAGIRMGTVPRMGAADAHELVKVHETSNMVQMAGLFLRGSQLREESRADHQRADHPRTDNERWLRWLNQSLLAPASSGAPEAVEVEHEPVPVESYRFPPEPPPEPPNLPDRDAGARPGGRS